jgi:hypothetical protein
MVKLDAEREITNIHENLQIIWSQIFSHMLLFIYIRSTLNIYWFIGIQICCQQMQLNSYLVTFDHGVVVKSRVPWRHIVVNINANFALI